MTWLNVFRLQPLLFDHVPLSWVPPMTSHELNGLIATLINWIVLLSFLSTWFSSTGTRDRSRLQPTLSLPVTGPPVKPSRPTSSHCDEMLVNVPLVRMTPPSEPSKIWVGLPGLTTIACWSGWMPFDALRQNVIPYGAYAHHGAGVSCASTVRSVNVRLAFVASGSPAVFEKSTARPFDIPAPWPASSCPKPQPTPFVSHGCSSYCMAPIT